jgi:HlyD family secretion protein
VPIQSVAVRTPEQIGVSGTEGEGEDGGSPRFEPDKDGFVEVVFVVEDGVAHARQVKTGIQSETHIELIEGIREGEQVVVGSYRAISRDLRDGTKVAVSGGGERAQG